MSKWIFSLLTMILLVGCGVNTERVIYVNDELNEVHRDDGESIVLPQENIMNVMTKEDVFIIELSELTDTMVQIDLAKDIDESIEDNDVTTLTDNSNEPSNEELSTKSRDELMLLLLEQRESSDTNASED